MVKRADSVIMKGKIDVGLPRHMIIRHLIFGHGHHLGIHTLYPYGLFSMINISFSHLLFLPYLVPINDMSPLNSLIGRG